MPAEPPAGFQDHFSGVAETYASARPGYPRALFDWIAGIAGQHRLAWEPGCGSGQASRDLGARFDRVLATDPSAAQVAAAHAGANVAFAVEPGERCSLADASVDAVCVAQALHWFDRTAFFDECARVLAPGGVLVAWGYQDVQPPAVIAAAFEAFRDDIAADWPAARADVDAGYRYYAWPFEPIAAPSFSIDVEWPLSRLLDYVASFSAVERHRRRHGRDPVARHAASLAAAWGDPGTTRALRWPVFVHARRKPAR